MAHSDGIRVVRYRSFEEICFNLRTYHHMELDDLALELARAYAGTEERIVFGDENGANIPGLRGGTDCGLPVFLAIDKGPECYVCAHLCEID